jgi:hypothetical protein
MPRSVRPGSSSASVLLAKEGAGQEAMTFVSGATLEQLTGKKRPSAQARWLGRYRYKFERRADRNGTIALRQEELDRHTLSKPAQPEKPWRVDMSQFAKAG